MGKQTIPECINRVEICGTIVHKFKTDNWTSITVSIPTDSEITNYPKVYWFDDMAAEVDANYNVGGRVEIVGQLRTSQTLRDSAIAGESISPTIGWFDAKFNPTEEFKPSRNEVLLKGEFVRAHTPNPGISIITIKVTDGEHEYYPQVACFGRLVAKAVELAEGEVICIVARIQTQRKETKKGTKYFQRIACREMRAT